jgi:hypothetical protein
MNKAAKFITISATILTQCTGLFAQNYNPPYPRVFFQRPTDGNVGGSCEQYFAKFDLSVFWGWDAKNTNLADEIRNLNPNAVVLAASKQGVWPGSDPPPFFMLKSVNTTLTQSTNGGESEILVGSTTGFPTANKERYALINGMDWITYESVSSTKFMGIPATGEFAVAAHESGEKLKTPIRFSGLGYLPNLTPLAEMYDGEKSWEYLVNERFERVDYSKYEGTFWDAFRAGGFWAEELPDADSDLNDVNDISEHGNSISWLNAQWREGIQLLLQYERQKLLEINPDKPPIVVINNGSVPSGTGDTEFLLDLINGGMEEGFMRYASNYTDMYTNMVNWMDNGPEILYYVIEDWVKEEKYLTGKNDFSYMRYGLSATLMGDGYYGRTFGNWYYISLWYDEFETELGYPKGKATKLANGAYVRFFDNGAVICNPSGVPITVTDANIASLSGYAGPYWRILGGQAPAVNNGEQFASIDLYGDTPDSRRPKNNRGDGIILMTAPDTVVSNILVGNCWNNDTSPGSSPLQRIGSWSQVATTAPDPANPTAYNPCYSQWNEDYASTGEHIGYSYAAAGDGSTTATYTPTIGVAGYYEISEWHGWVGDTPGSAQEATNVPFEVMVSGTRKIAGVINQSNRTGQWNRIAIIQLPAGGVSSVTITNRANGYVIADAMRFRYLGTNIQIDTVPPDPPQNLQILDY